MVRKFIPFLFFITTALYADPPARVARLGDLNGMISFLPAGEEEWVYATRNRPLITGDSLWVTANAKSELQLGDATICIGANTDISILNLTDNFAQFKLNQGTLNLRVWEVSQGQEYEIDTPNLAFSVKHPGYYRVNVNDAGTATLVRVYIGQADVYGEKDAFVIKKENAYVFTGNNLEYQSAPIPQVDDLEQWCAEHLQSRERSQSRQYVSPSIIGYEDLDRHGDWEVIQGYGHAWSPRNVPANWSPYSHGRWCWIEPWGWNWIGEEPWGFAPYHYGRWLPHHNSWYWVPGPVYASPIYAPALVGFIAGAAIGAILANDNYYNNVGWFPLGPRDIYIPPYSVTQNYFVNINTANTTINRNVIERSFADPNLALRFQNIEAPNAVVAAPINAFAQGRSVEAQRINIPRDRIAETPVLNNARVAPERESVLGGAQIAESKPSQEVRRRQSIAKTTPPEAIAPFEARKSKLAQDPGRPLGTDEMRKIQDGRRAPRAEQPVRVIQPKQVREPQQIREPRPQPEIPKSRVEPSQRERQRATPREIPESRTQPRQRQKAQEQRVEQPRVEQPRRQAPPQQRVEQPRRQAPPPQRIEQPRRQAPPQQRVEQPRRQAPPPQQRVEQPRRQAPPQQRIEQPRRQAPPQQRVEQPRRQAPPPQQRVEQPRRQAPPPQQRVEQPRRQAPPPQQRVEQPRRQAPPPQQVEHLEQQIRSHGR